MLEQAVTDFASLVEDFGAEFEFSDDDFSSEETSDDEFESEMSEEDETVYEIDLGDENPEEEEKI